MEKSKLFDLKSALIGFLSAALLVSMFGFNKAKQDTIGRYQVSSGEEGIIILDTRTGSYILDDRPSLSGKKVWTKGEFADTYEKGIYRAVAKKVRGN